MKLMRYAALFLAIVMCFALIGCGGKTEAYKEEGFVLITDVIPEAILEIRYYSTFNFVGERLRWFIVSAELPLILFCQFFFGFAFWIH